MTKESVVVVTGGAGFLGSHMVDLLLARGFRVRVIDNLVSGREVNLSHHQSNPHLQLDRRDIRALAAKDALFRDARYVFHFAGIGEIVPSIANPAEYMSANVQGTVHVLEGARWQGVKKFVLCRLLLLLRHSRRADGGGSPGLAVIPLRPEQISRRALCVSLAPGLWPAGNFYPYFQCLRHPVVYLGVLRGGFRCFPPAETGGQALHGGGRWHPVSGLRLCYRRGPDVLPGGGKTP